MNYPDLLQYSTNHILSIEFCQRYKKYLESNFSNLLSPYLGRMMGPCLMMIQITCNAEIRPCFSAVRKQYLLQDF